MTIFEKYLPLFAPETEAGTGEPGAGGGAPPPGGDGGREERGGRGDRGGETRRSLREDLTKQFEDARLTGGGDAIGSDERADRGDGRDAQGRLLPGNTARRRGAKEAGDGAAEPGAAGGAAQAAEGVPAGEAGGAEAAAAAAGTAPVGDPPAAWGKNKEALAAWPALPPAVQKAVLKREEDMQRGVDELKGRYAPLDAALAPHMNAIKAYNKTPAEAVDQLFNWFSALAANPKVAFPALAQSFKFDLASVAQPAVSPQPGAAAAQPAGGTPETGQPAGAIPAELQQYINGMRAEIEGLKGQFGQELGGLRSTVDQQVAAWQAQNEAKTNDVLMQWAKDKPHFERVRGQMAKLIGSGYIPLLADGRVDLDGAYDAALWGDKEIRAELSAAQQEAAEKALKAKAEAEQKAQQAAADKARKAAVSVAPGAPGASSLNGARARGGKAKSVRESLAEAIREVQS